MTKNLDADGLNSIVSNYDILYIDLWGVVHNGIKLHEGAIGVLSKLSELKKNYVLLTNAPRPNETVKKFLEKLGMNSQQRDHVYTSGQAALKYLRKNFLNNFFYHIGPKRDFDLFEDFKENKKNEINNSDYFICTGMFEDDNEKKNEDLNFYKKILEKHVDKHMICTNPDLIVDKGDKRELCAGSIALIFEKMGGSVTYFGKPYPEVYSQAIDYKEKKILCIGDNLNTDIKGANLLNFDSLIISDGIHKKEIEKSGIEKVSKMYESIPNYIQSKLTW